jgi:hypothetical protein
MAPRRLPAAPAAGPRRQLAGRADRHRCVNSCCRRIGGHRSKGRASSPGMDNAERGTRRPPPSTAILSGDSADVYFAPRERDPGQRRPRPDGRDGGLLQPQRGAVRHRRGQDAARPRAGRRAAGGGQRRGAVRWRFDLAQGSRAAHPCPLPGLRVVRDRLARADGPVDRLGDRGARVRRGGRARAGDQLRRAARPSRTSPMRSTTRPSSAAASAPRRPPGRAWPASRRAARCPTRWC